MKELSSVKCKTRRGCASTVAMRRWRAAAAAAAGVVAEAEAKRSTTYNGGCVVGCEATLILL